MPRAHNLTTFMYRLSRNSESLKLLEPQGTVQDRNGLANVVKVSHFDKEWHLPKLLPRVQLLSLV